MTGRADIGTSGPAADPTTRRRRERELAPHNTQTQQRTKKPPRKRVSKMDDTRNDKNTHTSFVFGNAVALGLVKRVGTLGGGGGGVLPWQHRRVGGRVRKQPYPRRRAGARGRSRKRAGIAMHFGDDPMTLSKSLLLTTIGFGRFLLSSRTDKKLLCIAHTHTQHTDSHCSDDDLRGLVLPLHRGGSGRHYCHQERQATAAKTSFHLQPKI